MQKLAVLKNPAVQNGNFPRSDGVMAMQRDLKAAGDPYRRIIIEDEVLTRRSLLQLSLRSSINSYNSQLHTTGGTQ